MNSPLPPKLSIRIHTAAKKDFLELRDSRLEEISYELINRLAYGDIRGTRLENHPEIGDLSDCFKLYFDLARDQSPRYRIVYKYLPSARKPGSIFIVAVGDRSEFKVYRDAIERLYILKEDESESSESN
jgi:hypothetical protein